MAKTRTLADMPVRRALARAKRPVLAILFFGGILAGWLFRYYSR